MTQQQLAASIARDSSLDLSLAEGTGHSSGSSSSPGAATKLSDSSKPQHDSLSDGAKSVLKWQGGAEGRQRGGKQFFLAKQSAAAVSSGRKIQQQLQQHEQRGLSQAHHVQQQALISSCVPAAASNNIDVCVALNKHLVQQTSDQVGTH